MITNMITNTNMLYSAYVKYNLLPALWGDTTFLLTGSPSEEEIIIFF